MKLDIPSQQTTVKMAVVTLSLLFGCSLTFGTTAFAQPGCGDIEAITRSYDRFTKNLEKSGETAWQNAITAAKNFMTRYGNCAQFKDQAEYINNWLRRNEFKTRNEVSAEREEQARALAAELARRQAEWNGKLRQFDEALANKEWDTVYSLGSEILDRSPETYRLVAIVLASVGGEEAIKGNLEYADEAVQFAKQAISDFELGKPFLLGEKTAYGLSKKNSYNFEYTSREDAIGWLNLYIGFINAKVQKNMDAALPYLFAAATQNGSTSTDNPIPFLLIGSSYVDRLTKITEQIQIKLASRSETDTKVVAKQKESEIEALVAMANGTAERALDSYARAHSRTKTEAGKASLRMNIAPIYKVRFGKDDGLDSWLTKPVTTPLPDPRSLILPIAD